MKRTSKPQSGKRALPKPRDQKRFDSEQRRAIRLATIGEVAAVLSHESRNLLGALKSCLQMLRRNPHLTSDDLELLDIIESGSNRLHEIITDFSAFRDSAPRALREVSLHDLLEEALASLQRDERFSSALAIEKRFDSAIHPIEADPDQLRHAFWHLCLNAAQAMRGAGTLTIETQAADGHFSLKVQDTGPGIPARIRSRIFEPLFTTKTRGAGLGLAIARRIIERHQGRINVVSREGSGATFTVRLPNPARSPQQPQQRRRGRSKHER